MKATVCFSAESDAAGVFGRTMARHLQAVMSAQPAAYSAVSIEERQTLPEEDDLVLGMAIDAEGPDNAWCVDLGAVLSQQPMRKGAVLSGLSEQIATLYGETPNPSIVLAIAEGLRKSRPLVALDRDTADTLNLYGCDGVERVGAPALPPFVMAPDPDRNTILVFDHVGSPIALGILKDAVGKASDDVTLCYVEDLMPKPLQPFFSCASYFSDWPLRAGIHIHIGTPRSDRLGTRIVDSQACNRPVIYYAPASEGQQRPAVAHERDGLVCTDGVELTAAINTLLSDQFYGELLAKNARRAVSAFNQKHMDALRRVIRSAQAA